MRRLIMPADAEFSASALLRPALTAVLTDIGSEIMPEGHTIHRLARDHRRDFAGQALQASSPQGRFADGASLLDGKRLLSVVAHGKHLCYRFSAKQHLHVHLGLYGRFRHHSVPPPAPRGAVRLRMVGTKKSFDLSGPAKCELLTQQQWRAILDRLGPDPLRDDANPEYVWDRICKSRQAIGKLLMDQSVVAGVGNVYRAEVLHVLSIHPERTGKEVSRNEFDQLWEKLVELMRIGVKYNQIIISDPAEIGKPRGRMKRAERLRIYKCETCKRCSGPVRRWELGARMTYACDRCQL